MKIIGIYMGVTLVSDHKDKPDIDITKPFNHQQWSQDSS